MTSKISENEINTSTAPNSDGAQLTDEESDAALQHFEQAFVRFATSTRQVKVASLDVFKPKKDQAEK